MSLKGISSVWNLRESSVVEMYHLVAIACDYQCLLEWKSSYHNNSEGLLKVTAGHVRYTSANISETAEEIAI